MRDWVYCNFPHAAVKAMLNVFLSTEVCLLDVAEFADPMCSSCLHFVSMATESQFQIVVMSTLTADGCFWGQLVLDKTEENSYSTMFDQLQ